MIRSTKSRRMFDGTTPGRFGPTGRRCDVADGTAKSLCCNHCRDRRHFIGRAGQTSGQLALSYALDTFIWKVFLVDTHTPEQWSRKALHYASWTPSEFVSSRRCRPEEVFARKCREVTKMPRRVLLDRIDPTHTCDIEADLPFSTERNYLS